MGRRSTRSSSWSAAPDRGSVDGQPADLIVTGRVATLATDPGWGWQPALAVTNGRVVAVGSESDLDAFAGPRTQRMRVPDDHIVLPGLTDAHLHLMTLILAERQIDLNGLDLAGALAAIHAAHAARAAAGDVDGWLQGHGWSMHNLGGWPDAEMLERVAPGRPVALYAHDHHARWVSHAAIRAAGIDGARGDTAGSLVRRDGSGRASGVLHENASAIVDEVIPD